MADDVKPEPAPTLAVMMMPKDANPIAGVEIMPGGGKYPVYSTIFGGVILSYIDMAGSIAARREILLRGGADAAFVTVAVNRVEFKQPVLVGDVVKFFATLVRIGRTSVTMKIDVVAERGRDTIPVTDSEVVYVGVNPAAPPSDRRPIPLFPPPAA